MTSASIDMLQRLVAFDTTSRNSNLDLIKYIQAYLDDHGIRSTLVPNEEGTKANLFASIGPEAEGGIVLSARTGEGLQTLRRQLLEVAGWQSAAEGVWLARERHVQALLRVREHLALAHAHLAAQAQSLDLLAEELRQSQNALNEITGEFSADDLLGVIFSSFCIGK